jgi:hypothetical protein
MLRAVRSKLNVYVMQDHIAQHGLLLALAALDCHDA